MVVCDHAAVVVDVAHASVHEPNARMRVEKRNGDFEQLRKHPVVVRQEERIVLSTRSMQRLKCSFSSTLRSSRTYDSRGSSNPATTAGVSSVEALSETSTQKSGVRLSERALDRVAQPSCSVVRRDHDRHARFVGSTLVDRLDPFLNVLHCTLSAA